MLVKTYCSAVTGVDAMMITAEVNLSGSHGFAIVGLPDNAVKESRERIEAAIRNNRYEYPRGKLTINLAPADVRKEGSAYDLTLAIGILAASGQISPQALDEYLIMGELSMDGTVKPIRGALPIAIEARNERFRGFILPEDNAAEAGIVNRLEVIPVKTLAETVAFLNGQQRIEPIQVDTRTMFQQQNGQFEVDFADVKGQDNAKRALEVAAAGGHNVLMVGPPGAGKTMLAKRIPTILPPLTLNEALEATKIYSVAGKLNASKGLIHARPFRDPHHTTSDVALVGGGKHPQPGEISLAHNGVLFLDEIPEFKRSVLEVLRQPLEDRSITISRATFRVNYPANFILVASMNPCPCGYYNHPDRECPQVPCGARKYLGRISGPLLDRIDIQVEVLPVTFDELSARAPSGESSASIRQRILVARERQQHRFQAFEHVHTNAMMNTRLVGEYCTLESDSEQLLKTAMERLNFSARAYGRILKVARTIADLDDRDSIERRHIAEAVQYRNLDRESWGR